MREKEQLKRVLSPRISVLRKPQQCDFCLCALLQGAESTSYGIIDRLHRTWSRVYFCDSHADVLENINNEDLPEFAQEYLIERGFTNEFYKR